jgi:hypothetical protein
LTVRQIVHLNMHSSLGHRTNDPHVMQRPAVKSLLPPMDEAFRCPRTGGGGGSGGFGFGLALMTGAYTSPSRPDSDPDSSGRPAAIER